MEAAATPTRISRVDLRFRPRAHHIPANEPHPRDFRLEKDEEGTAAEALDRKRSDPPTMGNDHRAFHRRAAQADIQIVTVNVEVVATVDTNGNVLGQATHLAQSLPVPSEVVVPVPSIPSVAPEIVPSIPAVPTLPSLDVLPSVVEQVVPTVQAVPTLPSLQVLPSVLEQVVPPVTAIPTLPSLQILPSVLEQVVPSASAVQSIVSAAGQIAPTVARVADVPALPSVPAVPPAPTPVLPSVPSVPPFPSTLVVPSVPPYPWPSSNPVAEAAAVSTAISSTPVSTNAVGSSVVPTPAPAVSAPLNSAIPSTVTALPVPLITTNGSLPPSSTLDSSDLPSGSSLSDATATLSGSTWASDAAATPGFLAPGRPGNPGVAPAATTAAIADTNAKSTPTPLQTPQVVGSIVGSLAGAALILAIVLLLLRRHKRRRSGALQLTGDDHSDANQQIMRQAPVRHDLIPAAFLNRFSGMSRSTAETSTSGGERSFQRVSGRKLPSAFSEGMTSEQFSHGGTMSGSSFYQDDHGIYGGPGMSKELSSPVFSKDFGKEIGENSSYRNSGPMNFRPSPARTPVIRHPDDAPPFGTNRSHLSPPQSPNADFAPRSTLGRSLPSADGSRSSRFTENV